MKRRIDPILIGLIGTALLATAPAAAAAAETVTQAEQDAAWNFMHHRAGPLVQAVRDATARYRDVSQAEADGYMPVLGCVSGPDMGAMGMHYLKASLLGDGMVDVAHPELLVYEPTHGGGARLVAVEYLALKKKEKDFGLEKELPPLRDAAGARLDRLLRRLRAGAPLPAHGDEPTCERCDHAGLCRRQDWA